MIQYNGLTLDAEPYYPDAVEGLLASPEVRMALRPKLNRDGLFPGVPFLGGRTISMTIDVVAWDEDGLDEALTNLTDALQVGLDEAPLYLELPGIANKRAVFLNARVTRYAAPISHEHFAHAATVAVEFQASDPRIYSQDEVTAYVVRIPVSGGLLVPVEVPAVVEDGGSSQSTTITNLGSRGAPFRVQLVGPMVNPTLTQMSTGRSIGIAGTIEDGDVVELDTLTHVVTFNGTPRYRLLSSAEWYDLDPGDNDIRLTADGSDELTATITYRHAWT